MKRLLMNNVAMLVAVAFCVLTLGACGESGTGNEGGGETPTPEEQIPTSGCDVYLFLGQSNMSGFGGEMIGATTSPFPMSICLIIMANFAPQRLL
jgi:hypothetical protein